MPWVSGTKGLVRNGVQGSGYSDENADKLCADWFDDGDALADVFLWCKSGTKPWFGPFCFDSSELPIVTILCDVYSLS